MSTRRSRVSPSPWDVATGSLLILVVVVFLGGGCERTVTVLPARTAKPGTRSAVARQVVAARVGVAVKVQATTGPQLILAHWPADTYGDGQDRLRIAVRNGGPGRLASSRVFRLLIGGTLHVRRSDGETRTRILGQWRGPAPPELAAGALGSHCMNGSVKGVLKGLGWKAEGRYQFWWTSHSMRSNDLTVRFPKPVCVCKPCGCRK